MAKLVQDLEVSRATIKRDLDYFRDRLNAPVVWDRKARGYRLDSSASLPTVYFTPEEIQGLLILHQFVNRINPGVARREFALLRSMLGRIGGISGYSSASLDERIRIIQIGFRVIPADVFESASRALLDRRKLHIAYLVRSRGEPTTRTVSPQRLVYYRNNWYLDSWCHLRSALRSFALDGIEQAHVLEDQAVEVDVNQLDKELSAGYGIFSGANTINAVLRFSPRAARWVSREHWHSAQVGHFDGAGYYVLELPYASSSELVMDILRYGPDVEVIHPQSLKAELVGMLRHTLKLYS